MTDTSNYAVLTAEGLIEKWTQEHRQWFDRKLAEGVDRPELVLITIRKISASSIYGKAMAEFVAREFEAPERLLSPKPAHGKSVFSPFIEAIDNCGHKYDLFTTIVTSKRDAEISASDILHMTNAIYAPVEQVKAMVSARRERHLARYGVALPVDDLLFCDDSIDNRFVTTDALLIFLVTEAQRDGVGIDWARLRLVISNCSMEDGSDISEWRERMFYVLAMLENEQIHNGEREAKKRKTKE